MAGLAPEPLIETENFIRFETVGTVAQTERGLLAELNGELLRVDVIRDDMVRVKISRARSFDEAPTYAVIADLGTVTADFTFEDSADAARLTTASLIVTLGKAPFRIDVHRTDGSAVVTTQQDGLERYWGYATLNDAFTIRRRCRQEDAFYGLGEKTGRFNRKGRDFTLWNTDVLDPKASGEFTARHPADDLRSDRTSTEFDPYYVSIPFFYHLADGGTTVDSGSGAKLGASFIDNGYRGKYEFSPAEEYRIHFSGGQYTEYIFAGPGMPEILDAYTWLTGRMQPPPIWALGHHQCRWFHYTQDAVEALAARHRSAEIPCDALWLDIEYMDGYRVFTWNTEAFPDVPGMLARLAAAGFRVITIIDPGVKYEPGYRIFDEGLRRDVFCRTEGGDTYLGQVWPGNTAFPDFATEAAREWWGELNAAHVSSGLAGIWNDMNEPATGTISPLLMRFGGGEFAHEKFHNQYALLMAMGTTDGLRKAMPELRTFVLSRAGFAGIQRYAANWLGDNMSRWDHLWMSTPMAMGLGISGQAFVGADIGGFAENSTPELFLRWMQCGTLTPFCRNHNEVGNIDQYPWAFGPVVLDIVREALNLRYRLLPYIYSAFLRAAESGAPVQRPLVFDYLNDPAVRDLDDEYLFGSDLLVAPVVAAGTTSRQVYLPAGTWYHWHTGEKLIGPAFVLAETPMEYIPIYARGGAIIPMWPTVPPSTAGHHPAVIELHLFVPTADGEYRSFLQEDDGLTFAAVDGGNIRTSLVLRRKGSRLTVCAAVTGSGYPEFARESFALIIHGAAWATVALNGATLRPDAGRYVLRNRGSGFVSTIDLG